MIFEELKNETEMKDQKIKSLNNINKNNNDNYNKIIIENQDNLKTLQKSVDESHVRIIKSNRSLSF